MTGTVPLVLEANAAFYRAFNEGDFEGMAALWSRRVPVACVHPGWPPLLGRPLVMESWDVVLRVPPGVSFSEAEATIWGGMAMVLCREHLDGATMVASNLFALESDGWHMVHHQSTPLAELPVEESALPISLH